MLRRLGGIWLSSRPFEKRRSFTLFSDSYLFYPTPALLLVAGSRYAAVSNIAQLSSEGWAIDVCDRNPRFETDEARNLA
jgi:hypothetical protein